MKRSGTSEKFPLITITHCLEERREGVLGGGKRETFITIAPKILPFK